MKLLVRRNIFNSLKYIKPLNFDEEEYVSKATWTLEKLWCTFWRKRFASKFAFQSCRNTTL